MSTGFFYAIGAAATWGLVYAIDQKILSQTSAITLLFIESIVTAIIVLPFVFSDRQSIKSLLSSGWTNIGLVLLSVLLAVLAGYLILSGIKLLGAPTASVIEIAYPLFVALFAALLFDAHLSWSLLGGGVLIFLGSAVITYFH